MTHAIIFSNNSPDLLDIFLSSAKDKNIKIFYWSVLYKSNEQNEHEYLELFKKYDIASYLKEINFKNDLLYLINIGDGDLVSFFKDTNYFFSEMPETNIKEIMKDEDIFCFSLGLGRNVTFDSYNDCKNVLLNEKEIGDNCMSWNSNKHYLSFGRSLELSCGYIYRKNDIYKMFKKWKYEDIDGLESSFDLLEYFPREEMASFKKSVCADIINGVAEKEKLPVFNWGDVDRQLIKV